MKRLLHSSVLCALTATFMLATICTSSYAQKVKNSIAIGAALFGVPTLVQGQYETRTTDDQSLVIRAMYGLKTDDGYAGFGLGAAYRFFINGDQPVKGLSVGPAVEILFYNNSATTRSARIFLIGAEAAYKLMIDQFSIEPVVAFRIGVSGGESVAKFTSTLVYPAIYLGYAW